MNVTAACGHRGKDAQHEAFKAGASKVDWPMSAHNTWPSRALDFLPFPQQPQAAARATEMRGRIERIADRLNIKIKKALWWDLGHTELA